MTASIIRTALRDLRRGYRGFWIFFGCLALGVAAITIVTVLSSSLLSGLERDGKQILGGDIAVQKQFRALTDEELQTLESYASEVARYIELSTLLRADDAEKSILVSLKAVDDVYPLFGTFEIQGGGALNESIKQEDGYWGALVDPSLVESGRAGVGDIIEFGTNTFKVTGVIQREPDRIGSSERFAFWPRVVVHQDSIENSGLLDYGSRSNFEYRIILKDGLDPGIVQTALQEQYPNLLIRDFNNAAPDLSELVQRIGVLLTLSGLTTLLIGGVGVSNAVRAYMDTRLRTIAILKCLGAPSSFVFRTYLFQIVLLSALGVLIGIILGATIAVVGATTIGQLLGVPLQISVSVPLLLIVVAYGMLTAMLFTLWPLASALNTPPASLFRDSVSAERQRASWKVAVVSVAIAVILAAIIVVTAYERSFAIWFVSGVTLAWIAFRVISAVIMRLAKLAGGRFSPITRLALANLHRPGAATHDTVLAIGLGLSVLIATAMVSANLDRQITGMIPEKAPDFFFIGIQSEQIEQFQSLVRETGGVSELSVLPYIPGRIAKIKGLDPFDALVDEEGEWMIDDDGDRAFSYTSEPIENTQVIEGEWWPPDYRGDPLLSIHKDVANFFAMTLGDEMTLNILGREITGTVHNIRDLDWRTIQLNFAVMLSPEPLQSIPHSSIATAYVSEDAEFLVQDRIAAEMPNVTVIRVKEALNRAGALISRARDAARAISAATIVAGILVLAGIIVSENRRRAYESVLLKTIGASRRYILATFTLEYLLQGSITAAVAVVVGSLTSWAVVSALMGWDWYFMPLSAANTAILGLVISLGLGMLGILRALQHRPLLYLRNE